MTGFNYPTPTVSAFEDFIAYIPLLLAAVDEELDRPEVWDDADVDTAMGYVEDLKAWLCEVLPTMATIPVGSIMAYAGDTAPAGWVLCNGDTLSRADYAALFAVIGTTYGDGNGSTTFNVPDLRAKSPLGLNPAFGGIADYLPRNLGDVGGAETHILTESEMPAHTHTYTRYSTLTSLAAGVETQRWGGVTTQNTGSKGGGQAHNNMHPFLVVGFIIKVQ